MGGGGGRLSGESTLFFGHAGSLSIEQNRTKLLFAVKLQPHTHTGGI